MNIISRIWQPYRTLFASSKRWIQFTFAAFFVAVVIGVTAYSAYPGLMEAFLGYIQQIAGENPELDNNLVLAIFRQNLQSSLFALLGGVFLGVLPFLVVWVNGFMVGYVAKYLTEVIPGTAGQKLMFLAAALLPHGIFELPIVLLSAALGLRLGLKWLKRSPDKPRKTVFKDTLYDALRFIPLLVIILVVAAFIEVYVSGLLASMLVPGQ